MRFYICLLVHFILKFLGVIRWQSSSSEKQRWGVCILAYWVGSSQTLPSLFPEQSSQIKLQILSSAKASSPFPCHWLTSGCILTSVSLWPSPRPQICSEYSYGIWAQTDVKDLLHKLEKPKNRLRECTWTLLIPPKKGKLKYTWAGVALYLTKEPYCLSTLFTTCLVTSILILLEQKEEENDNSSEARYRNPFPSYKSDLHNTLFFKKKARGRQKTSLPKWRSLMSCYISVCCFQGQHELWASSQLCSESARFPFPYAQIVLTLNQQKVNDSPLQQAYDHDYSSSGCRWDIRSCFYWVDETKTVQKQYNSLQA